MYVEGKPHPWSDNPTFPQTMRQKSDVAYKFQLYNDYLQLLLQQSPQLSSQQLSEKLSEFKAALDSLKF